VQVVVHVDGGARGNPGPAAAAAVVSAPDGRVLDESAVTLGRATNNVAEYRGLLLGLERAAALGATEVDVINDSELVARQIDGSYKVKNADLQPLHAQAKQLLGRLDRWSIRSVPRAENAAADALVNRALDGEAPVAQAADDDLVRVARRASELWAARLREELAAARGGRPEAAARAAAIERLLREQAELLMAIGVTDPPALPDSLRRQLRELRHER
jgi:ribonuclease HI